MFLQTPKMLFWQPHWKRFNKRPNIFVLKLNLLKEINDFQNKYFFLRILEWTLRKQFYESFEKKVGQKFEKIFRMSTKVLKKKSSKCCYEHLECSFDIPAANILTMPNNFGAVSKKDLKSINFAEKMFSSNLSLNT